MSTDSRFAPTPTHGAAYAVVIQKIGGVHMIADCGTREQYAAIRARLDIILAWARSQDSETRAAYQYGVDKVDADLRSRLEVHENSRRVAAASASLPKPDGL